MARVYIGQLSSSTRERDIERFFEGYGKLRDVILKGGFGFVEFNDYRDADDAVHDLNGRDLQGSRVRVEHTKRRPGQTTYRPSDRRGGPQRPIWLDKYGPPEKTRYRARIENLSTRVSWQDLKDMCRPHGEVTYADAHRERRNEGLICMNSSRDLDTIMEALDGKELNGRCIKLVDDRRSKTRSRSRSAHRSKERRGSRSRSRSGSARRRSRSGSRHSSRSRSRSASKGKSASRSRSRSGSGSGNEKKAKQENGGDAE